MQFVFSIFIMLLAFLSGCTTKGLDLTGDGPPLFPKSVAHVQNAVPKVESRSKYGNPAFYKVNGRRYHTQKTSKGHIETGLASWYGRKFHGRRTSSGEIYDMYSMTAAHKTLVLPTYVKVTNLSNQREVIVKVNDRGPFHGNRIIDLSYAAAQKLGIVGFGTSKVRVEAIDPITYHEHQTIKQAQKSQKHKNQFYLQIGAFSVKENADKIVKEIKSIISHPVSMESQNNGQQTIYKVQVGPFKSPDTIQTIHGTLADAGFDTVIPIVR